MIAQLKSFFTPKWRHGEAQAAIEASRKSLLDATINKAISQAHVQEMETILAQNNFGAHAIDALRLRGDI